MAEQNIASQTTETLTEVEDEARSQVSCDSETDRQTMTLGKLIEELMKLKECLGHNAPVWHIEFGSLTVTDTVEEHRGGVVIG